MWWLYLDESGDLGFDFVNKRPSRYFTICILAIRHKKTQISLKRSIRRTLKNKINFPKKRHRIEQELKGSNTRLAVKRYAWRMIAEEPFGIYCLTLNKRRVYQRLAENKTRVYNYITRLVVDQIPFEEAENQVQLIIDKSKNKYEIREFNNYIREQLEGRLDPGVSLDITHDDSVLWPGLQWADMFAWGVFQKYEHKRRSGILFSEKK